MSDWRPLAETLATSLPDDVPAHWRAAVASIPRHVLVPAFRATSGTPRPMVPAVEALADAYQDSTLFVGPDGNPFLGQARSPSALLRLFAATDIRPGHRVLVAGIDHGYDVALLAHVLGDAAVFAVDPDPAAVDGARTRLAEAGHWPTLGVGLDLPEYGPFDRILVTDEVRHVRWEWARQLGPSGLLGVDIAFGRAAGSRFRLHREVDRLTGRFEPSYRGLGIDRRIMPLPRRWPPLDRATAVAGTTTVSLGQHRDMRWLVWQATVPRPDLMIGSHVVPDVSLLHDVDGSWAEVETVEQDRDRTGPHTPAAGPPSTEPRRTWQGGPGRLWDEVERAHQVWTDLGEPNFTRFGYTATQDRQWLWAARRDSDDPGQQRSDPEAPGTWPVTSP
jgi:protein-L-isoaspartate O-methyltransferase